MGVITKARGSLFLGLEMGMEREEGGEREERERERGGREGGEGEEGKLPWIL